MLAVRVIVLAAVFVALMIVVVVMPVVMIVVVLVPMAMTALGLGRFVLILPAGKPHMHLHTLNTAAFLGLTFQTKFVLKPKPGELGLQIIRADAKINHGGKVHVAADSGKTVVVENLHITPVTRYCPADSRLWQALLPGTLTFCMAI